MRPALALVGLCVLLVAPVARGMDKARLEANVDAAVRKYGVSGRGVIVAILDRGIDWKNNDFRDPDGTTRIEMIFDLTDDTGANAANNPYRVGTLYTKEQINAALSAGTELAHRDAVGHGTTTTGIAAGNGRNSRDWKYRGEAPKARILVVKIVAGAAAHDDQPVEPVATTTLTRLPVAIDFVRDKARELGLPAVMLPNIGSVGGPSDGSSALAKKIDATVGPGVPGLIFVTGSSDDGGIANHASATVTQGRLLDLEIEKLDANPLRFDLWYPQDDRYDITIQTPAGTMGPFAAPAANNSSDRRTPSGVNYYHYGSGVTPHGAVSRREILIDFSGGPGRYVVTLNPTMASGGKFNAVLNTIGGRGRFLTHVVPGYTVWDAASASNNITPNDYVLRDKWADIDGVVRGIPEDKVGDLWSGSGIGPTFDGRIGIDVSAPGNSVFSTLAPKSVYATGRSNQVQDGAGLYTLQNAVSGASPQVTGIIALMLELNPTLDAKQVKDILQRTARRDDYTGAEPNVRWGYGKIDALAALTAVGASAGAKPYFSVDQNVISIDQVQGANATPRRVQLTPGGGAGAFVTSSSAPWLTVEQANGTAPAELVIRANPAGLALGSWSGEITIASADGKAVRQTIMVHLHIRTPNPVILSVTDGAAFQPGITSGSWITITGLGLSETTRIWGGSDFRGDRLPTSLDGVFVVVNGKAAYVYYISPTQINALVPDDLPNARINVRVDKDAGALRSSDLVVFKSQRNPEFFRFDGRYIAAVHLDGTFVGRPDLFTGVSTRAVKRGDTVLLFGTGCGPTNPVRPSESVVNTPAQVTGTVRLTIGGKDANTTFVGLSGSGLCQVNAEIPDLPPGDAEVILQIDSFRSADAAFVTVQ